MKKELENNGMKPDGQCLSCSDQEVKNDRTLEDSHIKNKSTIELFEMIQTEKATTSEVKPETPISNVKKNIQDKEGYPNDQQHFRSGHKKLTNERT